MIQTATNVEFICSFLRRHCAQYLQLPGGEYFPRSWLAVWRTLAISSCVHSLMSLTLWMAPAANTVPEMAGAALGSGTSKITKTPGPSEAVLYIEINFPPAASMRFLAAS